MKANIPLTALVGASELVLTSVNTNTRKFGADGKAIEGQVGDPRIEIVVMDSLEKQSVSVKALPPELANLTPQQIEETLRTRKYILLDFVNAVATPYANRSGFGISYSVKADSARIAKAPATPPPAPKAKS